MSELAIELRRIGREIFHERYIDAGVVPLTLARAADRIEALEADNKRLQSCIDEREEALRTLANPWQNQLGRIEALEAALREISETFGWRAQAIARAALAPEQDK